MEQPSFFSEKLNIFFKNNSKFEKNKELLDKASSDIKAVEQYLQKNGISTELRLVVESNENKRALISWTKNQKSEFRLYYECQIWGEQFNGPYGDYSGPGWCESENRPLIETKSDIRLRMLPYLPDFLARLQEKACLIDPSDKLNEINDIPF